MRQWSKTWSAGCLNEYIKTHSEKHAIEMLIKGTSMDVASWFSFVMSCCLSTSSTQRENRGYCPQMKQPELPLSSMMVCCRSDWTKTSHWSNSPKSHRNRNFNFPKFPWDFCRFFGGFDAHFVTWTAMICVPKKKNRRWGVINISLILTAPFCSSGWLEWVSYMGTEKTQRT